MSVALRAQPAIGLESFSQAKLIQERSLTIENYVFARGVYTKIGGVWRNPDTDLLRGLLTRQTFELPSSHTIADAVSFYTEQFDAMHATLLFTCDGRNCGASNTWANNHFKILQLYGLDQFQHYRAYRLSVESQEIFISLYAVRRGNQRSYVHIDVLESQDQPTE